jgi:hypothetical protein
MRTLALFGFLIFSAGLCSSAFGHAFTERISIPAPIRENIDHLRRDGRFPDRVAAFDQLIEALSHLGFESRDSALARTDLDRETLNIMLSHSRGIYSVGEILKKPFVAGGYSLGLSAVAGTYPLDDRLSGFRRRLAEESEPHPDLSRESRSDAETSRFFPSE